MKPYIDTILLDFDGTLFDTAPDLVAALNTLMNKKSMPNVEIATFRFMSGYGARHLLKHAFKLKENDSYLDELTEELISIYYDRLTKLTKPFPNVLETLKKLSNQGLKLGICTNKPRESTRKILRHFDMEKMFLAIVCGDEVKYKKPHAEHLLSTIRIMSSKPEKSVMVGDTKTDVDAAQAANLPVIIIEHGYSPISPKHLGAYHLIKEFSSLPQGLSILENRSFISKK